MDQKKRSKHGREEILRHIEEYGVESKDMPVSHPVFKHVNHQKKRKNQRRLDLHFKTREEAAALVRTAVESCCNAGVKHLLIIHGKGLHAQNAGESILKLMVIEMLQNELASKICGFRRASLADGGSGATLVEIRIKKVRLP